jgi:hypothetical protein
MKNLKAKTRPASDPYETITSNGWTWKILKHYQTLEKEVENPYARVFCHVTSPFVPEGEMGDVYCADIPGYFNVVKN